MKKTLLLGFSLFVSFGVYAAHLSDAWTIGNDHFELKSVGYDESITNRVNNLIWEFHKKDQCKNQLSESEASALFQKFSHKLAERTQKFKDGECFLLVVFKNGDIVGGSYYAIDENAKIVLIAGMGYDESILLPGTQENAMAKEITMDQLSSRENFPQQERLIVFLRRGSDYLDQVSKLNFVESNYTREDLPTNFFCSFERAIH